MMQTIHLSPRCLLGFLFGFSWTASAQIFPVAETFENPPTVSQAHWEREPSGNTRVREVGENPVVTSVAGASERSTTGGPRLRGNVYAVTTSTHLSEIESYLTINAPQPFNLAVLTFSVYEADAQAGPFTRVFNQQATVTSGTQFFSSGPLNQALQAGKFYLITTSWSLADTVYFFYNSEHPVALPFGETRSGFGTNDNPPPATLTSGANTSLYRQRLSTHDGNLVLRLDGAAAGSQATASATVRADLDGVTGSQLWFRHRESGDEPHPEDGVFLSVDGTTFHKILDLDYEDTDWHDERIDLDTAAANAGITLGPSTHIRFQQHDTHPWPSDGREIDDVYVHALSGTLRFGGIATAVSIDAFEIVSPTVQRVSGTGSVGGLAFQFTDLRATYDPATGDLLAQDSVPVAGQVPGQHGGWETLASGLTLSPGGLAGTLRLVLPDSLSVNGLAAIDGFTLGYLPLPIDFDADLQPIGSANMSAPSLYWYPECLPIRIRSDGHLFNADADPPTLQLAVGDVEYVFTERDDAFPRIGEDVTNPPASRPALPHNLQYFRHHPAIDGGVVVIDPDGANFNLDLFPDANATHESSFPQGVVLANLAGGSIDVRDGVIDYAPVDPANPTGARSFLRPAAANGGLILTHFQGCDSGFQADPLPMDRDVVVLPNGGLLGAAGPGNGIADLQFGAVTLSDTRGGDHLWHVPGCAADGDLRPEVFLNAAQQADADQRFHPGSAEFTGGRHAYAGLNIVPPASASAQVGFAGGGGFGIPVASPASKLYLRLAGVSGSLNGSISQLHPTSTVYGFPFTFSDFGLNFIDSESSGQASRSNGQLTLPHPANIQLDFRGMDICGCGDLRDARPLITDDVELAYWKARIVPVGIEFRNPNSGAADCGTGDRELWLSSINELGHFDTRPFMRSRFAPDGNMVESDVRNGPAARVDGYPFRIQRVYLNQFDPSVAGFYNVVGPIHLPYFGDTPSLVHAAGRTGTVERLRITEGRAFVDQLDPDPDRNGVPVDTRLDLWRNESSFSTVLPAYLIHARQRFAGVVPLEYPLQYNDTTRRFASPRPLRHDWWVFRANSKIKRLHPEGLQLDFGLTADFTQPLSLREVLLDITAPEVLPTIDLDLGNLLAELRAEIDGLDTLLSAGIEEALLTQLDGAIRDVALPELCALADAVHRDAPQNEIDVQVTQLLLELNVIDLLHDELTAVGTRLSNDLDEVAETLSRVLARGSGVPELLLTQQLQRIAASPDIVDLGLQGVVLSLTNQITELVQPIYDLADDLQASLDEIEADLDARLAEVQAFIDETFTLRSADIVARLETPLRTVSTQMQVTQRRYAGNVSADQLKEVAVDHLLRVIGNQRFMDSVHTAVTENIQPAKERMFEALEGLAGEANLVSLDLLDELNVFPPNPESVSIAELTGIKKSKLNGYGIFNRETFEQVHIDGELTVEAPVEDLVYKAALDIKRRHIAPANTVCDGGLADESVDATISAFNVGVDWISPDLEIERAALTFSFQDRLPIGLHGAIDMPGELSFESVAFRDLHFRAGVGRLENYLAASGAATFRAYELEGGIFVGLACDPEPLHLVDPEVGELLDLDSIYGVYLRAKGRFPIYDAGCLFRIGASGDLAIWYFDEGPTYGGRLGGSFYGKVGCLAGARGTLNLIGSRRSGSRFTFAGDAWAAAGVGDCAPGNWKTPADVWRDDWCYTCVATMNLLYNGEWHVDYDVDCE